MKYWLTTQWPPRGRRKYAAPFDCKEDDPYVWLQDKYEAAGAGLAPGNRVLVYEFRSGPTVVRKMPDGSTKGFPCRHGECGIIYYGEVTEAFSPSGSQPEGYADGDKEQRWWKLRARIGEERRGGSVRREDVAVTLGYSRAYVFRGFGQNSGLCEISPEQFRRLVDMFHGSQRAEIPSNV